MKTVLTVVTIEVIVDVVSKRKGINWRAAYAIVPASVSFLFIGPTNTCWKKK